MTKSLTKDYPKRILILVPGEPDLDPRLDSVIKLCAEIGKTDVLSFADETQKPLREYDQKVYRERVLYETYPLSRQMKILNRIILLLLTPGYFLSIVSSRFNILNRKNETLGINHSSIRKTNKSFVHSIQNSWNHFYNKKRVANTLFQRARASSIIPRVIICLDIQALEVAVMLKKKFKTCLLYDCRELSIDANPHNTGLKKIFMKRTEDRLIRCADIVIAADTQLVRKLDETYGVQAVLALPDTKYLPYSQAIRQWFEK